MHTSIKKEQIYSLKQNMEILLNGRPRKEKREIILERLKYLVPREDSILENACCKMGKKYRVKREEIIEALSFGKRPEEIEEIRKYHEDGQDSKF